ncbi:MAG: glucokinase [bacterium]
MTVSIKIQEEIVGDDVILAGDIGGTKTVLGLFEEESDGRLRQRVQLVYPSREYAGLEEILQDMATRASLTSVTRACFGIAGPVVNGRCRTTNLPWEVDEESLGQLLGIPRAVLLNDLEAAAYGMLYLDDDDLVDLNPTGRQVEGNVAVIAAGTGLGEAMLFWDGEKYHPIASEGGHCDFAPSTPQQDELLCWLRNRWPGHVSFERLLSGPGVFTLYQFLRDKGYADEPLAMRQLPEGADSSAMVSECALRDHDPLCTEALRLFVEIYGAEAGNLALKSLSVGGVFVGGGIAPKILPLIHSGGFLEAFMAKGRFEELLRGMSVRVSTNALAPLIGAANFANRGRVASKSSSGLGVA